MLPLDIILGVAFVSTRPAAGTLAGMSSRMQILMATPKPPPLTDARRVRINYKEVASRAAAGCKAAWLAGVRRVSCDIPQIGTVDRSTTARKFEDDNNFLLALVGSLGGGRSPEAVGADTSIMMGGFEGGGDYLREEGLYGYRWRTRDGPHVAIANSEIDASALRKLGTLDDGGRVLIFNCNLGRLSFFDKMGMPSLDDVEPAYLLRRQGAGFVSRQFPEDYCAWRLQDGKAVLVAQQPEPLSAQNADSAIRTGR